MALPEENKRVIRRAVRSILKALGEDVSREGLKDTPKRVADLFDDVLDGNFGAKPKTTMFTVEEKQHQIVAIHGAPFYGFCEHHLLPFVGCISVGYVPWKNILGLSKLIRIVRHHSKRVTIQERLTEDAVDEIMDLALPRGAIVYVRAEHLCMSLRGVKSPGAKTTTIAYRGIFEDNLQLRNQFLAEAASQG